MPRAQPIQRNFKPQNAALSSPHTRQGHDFMDAIAKLQGELQRQPRDPQLHLALAQALLRKGRKHQAEHHLAESLRLDPERTDAWTLLGVLLERRRAYAEAAQFFQAATRKFPGNPDFWIKLGRARRREGHAANSAVALREALRLKPGTAAIQYELGLALQLCGEMTEARTLLQQSLVQVPTNILYRTALANVESALFPPVPADGDRITARVGLHLNRAFHFSILDPIFQALRARHPVLLAAELALLGHFQPDVIVVADAQGRGLRERFPDAIIVFVRHGLITKRHLAEAAAGCDFVAGVSSDTIRDEIASHSGIPADRIWVTGHVPMDPLFRGERTNPDQIPLPRDNKTVLFAPTWNRGLSALGLLGQHAIELLLGGREDINLIIKPHPVTLRDQGDRMSELRQAAQGRKNVWLVEDAVNDGMALLPLADVLVSDASSLIFAFLACDRPLVLVTHPDRKQDPGYDENGIEWRWRDVGDEVMDINTLPVAIQQALQHPERKGPERAHYRQLLFGTYTDGHAAERIANRIGSLPRRGSAAS